MSAKKSTTPRKSGARRRPTITRTEALRLHRLMNSTKLPSKVSFEIAELADVITNEFSDITYTSFNRKLFVDAMLDGFTATGERARYWQGQVRQVLDRTAKGESPESIIADLEKQKKKHQRRFVERRARAILKDTTKYTKGTREAVCAALEEGDLSRLSDLVWRAREGAQFHPSGEPVNQLSDAWRYWKLRKMEKALRGEEGPEAQAAAQREFKQIARQAINIATFDFYQAEDMLPHFISALQQQGGVR